MKVALLGLCLLVAMPMAGALLATPVAAEPPGAAATATAHALDELKNAIAQGRITLTPTPSPTLTATPLPATDTPTPAPLATDTPEPAPADPPLPLPDLGQAMAAYVRPEPRDPTGAWLQLALPRGRWAVLYDATLCTAPAPWSNVWLALDDASHRPITADRDDGATCAIAQWSWSSDVPCAMNDQGTCDLNLDGAYWDAIAQAQPTATDTIVPTSIVTPTPRPAPPRAATPVVAAAQVQRVVETVVSVQTVLVVVTPEVSDTPTPKPAQAAPAPSLTPMRYGVTTVATITLAIALPAATATEPRPATPTAAHTPEQAAVSAAARPGLGWFGAALAMVTAAGVLVVVMTRRRRRLATWKEQPDA